MKRLITVIGVVALSLTGCIKEEVEDNDLRHTKAGEYAYRIALNDAKYAVLGGVMIDRIELWASQTTQHDKDSIEDLYFTHAKLRDTDSTVNVISVAYQSPKLVMTRVDDKPYTDIGSQRTLNEFAATRTAYARLLLTCPENTSLPFPYITTSKATVNISLINTSHTPEYSNTTISGNTVYDDGSLRIEAQWNQCQFSVEEREGYFHQYAYRHIYIESGVVTLMVSGNNRPADKITVNIKQRDLHEIICFGASESIPWQ